MEIFMQEEVTASIPWRLQHGPKESATLLGISERKLYSLIESERVKSHKLDGKRFVLRETLETFVSGLGA